MTVQRDPLVTAPTDHPAATQRTELIANARELVELARHHGHRPNKLAQPITQISA